jgi:hypothetical protein
VPCSEALSHLTVSLVVEGLFIFTPVHKHGVRQILKLCFSAIRLRSGQRFRLDLLTAAWSILTFGTDDPSGGTIEKSLKKA